MNAITDSQTSLRIEMLGGFTIYENGRLITEQVRKTTKVWKLVQYLIVHRDRAVSQEELFETICREEIDNSGSTLRTMVYRARAALAESGLECADDVIIAKGGCYSWNNSIKCTIDTEEFEEYAKKALKQDISEDEKLDNFYAAANLYKGDFLPSSSGEMWVLPLVREYRSLYLSAVHEALNILIVHGRVEEAEKICLKALKVDPYDEVLIMHHLRSLIAQGKNAEALEAYKKMESMFFDEMGVNFSDELHALYNEIEQKDSEVNIPLDDVVAQWHAEADKSGAHYCNVTVFKTLYLVESRSAPRSGRSAFIVKINTQHEPNPKITEKDGGVMKHLERAIANCLRMDDVFTRDCPNSYMLLLRNLTYEDCKMLITRIYRTLDRKYLPKIVDTTIKHVNPSTLNAY